jgi:hypothetical protein
MVGVCLLTWLALGGMALAEDLPPPPPPPAAPAPTASQSTEVDATPPVTAKEQEAQEDSAAAAPAKNGVFLEGLGPGILYSVNYERLVIDEVAVRVGFSYWSVSASVSSGDTTSESSSAFLAFPVTVTYVGVKGLEVGGGMTLMHASGSGSTVGASASGEGFLPLGTALVGYRSHPVGGAGFQFRVGAMAMAGEGLSLSTSNPDGFGVLPWLYLSAGAGF